MGALSDDDRVYRLELGLDEPITRAALLDAQARGLSIERVALDCEQPVDAVRTRLAEEDLWLPSAWARSSAQREHVLEAARAWRCGLSIRAVARLHKVDQSSVARCLTALGYADLARHASAAISEAQRAVQAARRAPIAKKLKRLLRERKAAGLPLPLANEAARLCGTHHRVIVRVAQELGITLGEQERPWCKVIDLVADGAELPAGERPRLVQLARDAGVSEYAASHARRLLGVTWREAPERRQERVIAAVHASPLLPRCQIAKACGVSPSYMYGLQRAGLILSTQEARLQVLKAYLVDHPQASLAELADVGSAHVDTVREMRKRGEI